MSDSVDRVFVHALNTVKKIPRTGTARPPAAERLKLYGLYKQSMEGDVEGIMDRPIGDAPDVQAEREKWDAWYSQRGSSRTEAKSRYITTLINTMHLYASQTAEARELVAELEFVWDQIKNNNHGSSSSSSSSSFKPMNQASSVPVVSDRRYGSINDRMARSLHNHEHGHDEDEAEDQDLAIYRRRTAGDSRLRVLSPVSQSDGADVPASTPGDNADERAENEDEDVDDEDEFQEARDGTSFSEETTTSTSQDHNHNHNNQTFTKGRRKRSPLAKDKDKDEQTDNNWRRRVEQALTKMTVEIAALREQIESRPIVHTRRRTGLWAWLKWLLWHAIRQMVWQCCILCAVLLWMRLIKGDRRLEHRVLRLCANFKTRLFLLVSTMMRRGGHRHRHHRQ